MSFDEWVRLALAKGTVYVHIIFTREMRLDRVCEPYLTCSQHFKNHLQAVYDGIKTGPDSYGPVNEDYPGCNELRIRFFVGRVH